MSVHKWVCTLVCYVLLAASVMADALDHWHWRYPLPQANNLLGAAYGNGVYVAVGEYGTILYSTNLQHWATAESSRDAFLSRILYAQDKFVAVGEAGTILWSSNGVAWSEADSGVLENLWGIAYGNGTFVAVGEFGVILSSADEIGWTQEISGTFSPISDVA